MAASLGKSLAARLLRKASHRGVYSSLSILFYSSDEHLSKYSYWQKRYQQSASKDLQFDWFLDSSQILDVIIFHMDQVYEGYSHATEVEQGKKASLWYLDVGCGTSDLAHSVYCQSLIPVNLVLLDFVREALQYQKQHIFDCITDVRDSSFCTVCADVTCLPFCDSSFHVTVDKGTMDALLKDRRNGHANVQTMMSEVLRIMTPGGRFLQISDEDPDTRLLYLEQICQESQKSVTQYSPKCDNDLHHSEVSHMRGNQQVSKVANVASGVDARTFENVTGCSDPLSKVEPEQGREIADTFLNAIPQTSDRLHEETLFTFARGENMIVTSDWKDSDGHNKESDVEWGVNKLSRTTLASSPFKEYFTPWSFKVIPSPWGSEYFIYWMEKLK